MNDVNNNILNMIRAIVKGKYFSVHGNRLIFETCLTCVSYPQTSLKTIIINYTILL